MTCCKEQPEMILFIQMEMTALNFLVDAFREHVEENGK